MGSGGESTQSGSLHLRRRSERSRAAIMFDDEDDLGLRLPLAANSETIQDVETGLCHEIPQQSYEEDEDEDAEGDDNGTVQEVSVWRRIPVGLKIASGLFLFASLSCLRIVFLYETQSHGTIYALLFALTLAATFGFSAYIVAKSLWNAQMDLEVAFQEQERTEELLHQLSEQVQKPEEFFAEAKKQDAISGTTKSTSTDLYPETTVFSAKIVGFHAWASARSPSQVFELLDAVFSGFDELAGHYNVLKVDTIANSYFAVTGVPVSDPDHGVNMVRFAADALSSFKSTIASLEATMGPDTGDLQLRTGLQSGPITGGNLRGGRFQLFGGTLNKAIQLQQSCIGNSIQLSWETSEILKQSDRDQWVECISDSNKKSSSSNRTYWLRSDDKDKVNAYGSRPTSAYSVGEQSETSFCDTASLSDDSWSTIDDFGRKIWTMNDVLSTKQSRLIEWTVEQLSNMLKKIVARRQAIHRYKERLGELEPQDPLEGPPTLHYFPNTGLVIEEVKDAVHIPKCDIELLTEHSQREDGAIELPQEVVEELTNLVSTISTFYHDPGKNPFHNFHHASHVLMSASKMLQRIVSPSQAAMERTRSKDPANLSMEELTDHTFGIAADPLTQFAILFAALIHDLDHPGVPNAQLVKEQTRTAKVYSNRSVSEQQSMDAAWDLLMDPSYQQLVRTICGTQDELKRFRQILVNAVMATDIACRDLKTARTERWEKTFGNDAADDEDNRNQKATIVIELLMQASDVSHTMQHWEVFRKWNERLFREMYLAYLNGRAERDPSEFWYQGEIGFFQYYIIPLAERLKECGVFGVSSNELLHYAQTNLSTWEQRGQAVVKELTENVRRDYGIRTQN